VASPLFYAFVRGKSLNPAVRNFATETSVCGIHSEYFVFACTVLIGLQSMTDRYAQRERDAFFYDGEDALNMVVARKNWTFN